MPRNVIPDIIGARFGRLTPLEVVGRSKKLYVRIWRCHCDCGKTVDVYEPSLLSGRTSSCGCLKRERLLAANLTHGRSSSRLYRIWTNMKTRCSNPHSTQFKWYGGRGISFTSEWSAFEPFMNWALSHGYEDTLELDRIDTNGDYSPENCRFVTHKENCNNRRK